LNSGVLIGEGSFVGCGVAIKQGVHIGKYCLVGMGLAVRRDCQDGTVLRA
jgi:acetyltransferase-like isoleucine patch superfamily enzyme